MDIWHVQLFFCWVFVSDDFTLSPLGVPAVRWILKGIKSPCERLYRYRYIYGSSVIRQSVFMLLVTWRCCSPAWPLLNEKQTGGKKLRVKGGAPKHTHRLHNRHGPVVAQRCLEAKTNSPRKFVLVSCFELPKQTSFWPDFVWNYVISSFLDFVWSISVTI